MASWLVRSSETLRCVLEQDTLLSRCLSSPKCINRYAGYFNAGGNPAME